MIKTLLVIYMASLFLACNTRPPDIVMHRRIDTLVAAMRSRSQLGSNSSEALLTYLDSLTKDDRLRKDIRLQSEWNRLKGVAFMMDSQFDSAHYYALRAHAAAEKVSTSSEFLIRAKIMLIQTFTGLKKYDSAAIYGLAARQLSKGTTFNDVADIHMYLGNVYSEVNDTLNRRYHLMAGYSEANNPETKMILANGIAQYYFDKYRWDSTGSMLDSVKRFHNMVMADSIHSKNPANIIAFKSNIGIMFSVDGNLQEGIRYFEDAIAVSRRLGIVDERPYMNIAQNYAFQQQFKKAVIYIDSALEIAKSKGNYRIISVCYNFLSENLKEINKIDLAYKALDSARKYDYKYDSLAFIQKTHEIEARYAVKSKDEEIASLNTVNRSHNKIQKQQSIIMFILGTTIALLLIIGLQFFRRRQLKTQLRESELEHLALRSQMNPHFVFNALSALQGFIRNGESANALEYNSSFAQLLRRNFENVSKKLIPLTDEIAFLENYLSLQKMQLENRFDYLIEVYPGYQDDDGKLPPMLLQPFVENAILHGFVNLAYRGRLIIRIAREQDMLHCTIEDNGIGLSQPNVDISSRSHSTSIIRQRLLLLSRGTHNRATLDVADKKSDGEGSGVRVILMIPFYI